MDKQLKDLWNKRYYPVHGYKPVVDWEDIEKAWNTRTLSQEKVEEIIDNIYHKHNVPGHFYSFVGTLAQAIINAQGGE